MKCFEVLFYRYCSAGDTIQFTILEKDDNNIAPKIEERKMVLQSKWEYQQFMQGNEKNYLVA